MLVRGSLAPAASWLAPVRPTFGMFWQYANMQRCCECSTVEFSCLFSCYDLQPAPRNLRNRTEKFDKNITKRGNVPIGKAAERNDDFPVSKALISFFLIVVVGSSLVQIFNMFMTAKPP